MKSGSFTIQIKLLRSAFPMVVFVVFHLVKLNVDLFFIILNLTLLRLLQVKEV